MKNIKNDNNQNVILNQQNQNQYHHNQHLHIIKYLVSQTT